VLCLRHGQAVARHEDHRTGRLEREVRILRRDRPHLARGLSRARFGAAPKPLKSTFDNERFMALHMMLVRMIPLAPTRAPATISRLFNSTNPAAQAASPE